LIDEKRKAMGDFRKMKKMEGWWRNLRALVDIPKIHALEGIGADHIRAGFVRGTTLLQVPGHCGLTPLGAIHRRWQGKMFTFKTAEEKNTIINSKY